MGSSAEEFIQQHYRCTSKGKDDQMVKYIIAAMFAVALVIGASHAKAQLNCTQVGNSTICNGPSGSVTCTRVGNNTMCN